MGNKIARTTQASATEYYLHDLPSTYNLVLLHVVSRGRFLKSVLCKHDEGLLLVKVYFKRAGEPLDLKVTIHPSPLRFERAGPGRRAGIIDLFCVSRRSMSGGWSGSGGRSRGSRGPTSCPSRSGPTMCSFHLTNQGAIMY
jgi:phosphoinositide-3-kinase regulatory subunit 4